LGYSDGTLALMGHLLLPTASEAKREGGPTIKMAPELILWSQMAPNLFIWTEMAPFINASIRVCFSPKINEMN
jgi:hypothetical protein